MPRILNFHEWDPLVFEIKHKNWLFLTAPFVQPAPVAGATVVYKGERSQERIHSVVTYERINKQLNYEGYGK